MRLPEVANRLREIAAEHKIGELEILANEIRRRPIEKRAPDKSRPMTPELAAEILDWCHTFPTQSQAEVARRFNVNPGRVSEALRGFRE